MVKDCGMSVKEFCICTDNYISKFTFNLYELQRKEISIMVQNDLLFLGTIKENTLCGNNEDLNKYFDYLKLLNFEKQIDNLNLSGGEKRIIIFYEHT